MLKYKLLIIFALICATKLYSQECKSMWKLNVLLSHYERQKKNELTLGDLGYKIVPGLEILYSYTIKYPFLVSTGFSYQYVDLISYIETSDKFQVGEFSIPLLLTVDQSRSWSFSTGVYSGKFLHLSWNQKLHGNWTSINPKERVGYSENSFFMDAYFDIIYSNSHWLKSKNGIKIAPFVRYRFKENWMENYRTSFYYGIKLGIDFKIKEK